MTNYLMRYWKTLAVTSVSLASTYFYVHNNSSKIKTHGISVLTIHAAEYERRNASKDVSEITTNVKQKHFDITDNDDDDDDDDDDDNNERHKDVSTKLDKSQNNIHQQRFRQFASVEYNGEIYMTPLDFLESVVSERPRPRIGRRQLTADMVESILYNTPPKHRGSKRFFRQLEDSGLISFSEYLFLWVILTKPSTEFNIAFSMFDMDGNQFVDKHEFLILEKIMSDTRILYRKTDKDSTSNSIDNTIQKASLSLTNLAERFFPNTKKKHFRTQLFDIDEKTERTNTTLILHFFGKNGRDTLNYAEFKRFTENFQREVLEIEFSEFSRGFKTISDLDFAEILLRYTNLDHNRKKHILKKIQRSSEVANAITFEQFQQFFNFLNNLKEFSVAMRFHQLSNKPISQAEFQRAARISTGSEIESHIVSLIFRMFDADDDLHLSYEEFMDVMKHRLSRSFQTFDCPDAAISKFDELKRCICARTKYKAIIDEN